MITPFLAVAGPWSVYTALVLLSYGLWLSRRDLDWRAGGVALVGTALALLAIPAGHRTFFDEDTYIAAASNLALAPVYQVTIHGAPGQLQASSYYKAPPGWPVLLSFAFVAGGSSEAVAFRFHSVLFGVLLGVVFLLARAFGMGPWQAVAAAAIVAALPPCLDHSGTAGNDTPAALMAAVGLWGLLRNDGPVAAAGFALAALTRMELLLLAPLFGFHRGIRFQWKLTLIGILLPLLLHIAWVLAIAPELSRVERVAAPFSMTGALATFIANAAFLLHPSTFSPAIILLALFGVYRAWRTRAMAALPLALPLAGLFLLYGCFYAGSFEMNPRYCIQLAAPLAVFAASQITRPTAVMLLTLGLPYIPGLHRTAPADTDALEHRTIAALSENAVRGALVVTPEQNVFFNFGSRVMHSRYAALHADLLEREVRKGPVWYFPGMRSQEQGSEEFLSDQWLRDHFELLPSGLDPSVAARVFRIALNHP